MTGVTITYQGSTIASLTNSGQKTLLTAGKYCEANIGVDYTAPSSDIAPVKDGLTRLYIDIPSDCDFLNKLSIPLYWNQSVSEGVTIDWGDNSPTAIEKVSGTGNVSATPHTYAAGGRYIVTMKVDDGCTVMLGRGASGTGILGDASITTNAVRMVLAGVETGSRVTTIQSYCFCRHAGIMSVYFGPDLAAIQNYGFAYSWHLGGIHFLGTQLPSNANIGSTNVWSEVPNWCKIYVPSAYIDSQGNPQNIPARMPSTSTYTYAEEPST